MNGPPPALPGCSLVVPVVFSFLALVALVRGKNSSESSRRLAGVSLACGLLIFAPFEWALGLTAHEQPTTFRIIGAVRIVLGGVGVVWGIRALRLRRVDHGTGVARPLIGAVLSAGQAGAGSFLIFLTSSAFAPAAIDPKTAWVFKDPTHGIEITLPSENWRETTGPGGLRFFVHRTPAMQAGIFLVKPAPTEASFREFADNFMGYMARDPERKASLRTRDGTNEHGHRYIFATCAEPSGHEGRVFVGSGIVWCEDRGLVVQVMFEGKPRFMSRMGTTEEIHTMETCAEAICLSVK